MNTNRFPWKISLILYVCSFGLMLTFLDSYFWDDWKVYASLPKSEISKQFWDAGYMFDRGFFELEILGSRPEIFRILTLICYFLSGWCLFYILSTLRFLSNQQVKIITLLFLVLPINSARVAMIDFAYAWALLLFYLSWYLLVKKESLITVLVAVALLVLSFGSTAALIVFMALPCAHRLYLQLSEKLMPIKRALLGNAGLLLIAPAYWFLDRRINPPRGNALVMYSLQTSGVIRALLLLLISLGISVWYLNVGRRDAIDSNRYLLICCGFVSILIAAAPYVVAGHLVDVSEWMLNFVPRESDWQSRHQLTIGLGLSVLIVGILGELKSTFKRRTIFSIIGVCVILNVTYMHAYFLDSLKQDQVMDAIAMNHELDTAKVIVIDDQAIRFNARGRGIRSYEWNAMLFEIYKNDSKKIIDSVQNVECESALLPGAILTITANNGRLKATLLRDLGIHLIVVRLSLCP